MVELTRKRGIDARLGNVQGLPFEDGEFDCAVAAWMLYHVSDIDRALGELARVLRPDGHLVAVTNSREHLRELKDLLGIEGFRTTFERRRRSSCSRSTSCALSAVTRPD